jgi:hypothetical protein
VELRPTVDGERRGCIRLDVRLTLRPVEDVVARERDERRAERGDVRRPADVAAPRPCGSSSAPSTFVQAAAWRTRSGVHGAAALGGTSHAARSSASTSSSANARERVAELAARARDQGAASRSERIGVVVLHRCATRGSFHGTPCSSGSAGRTPRSRGSRRAVGERLEAVRVAARDVDRDGVLVADVLA